MLLQFPGKRLRRHWRASAGDRAASAVIIEAVRPTERAGPVASTADHHSAGIESRCHHLETADALAPMSDAMASFEPQSSMIERNVVASDMVIPLGHLVLNGKAKTSYDCGNEFGDTAAMADRVSETEEKFAFIRRVKAARLDRFKDEGQKPICIILDVPQDKYKHYEKRTPLPWRFIPKFCAACGVSMEWLLTGEGKGPIVPEIPKETPHRIRRVPRGKAA